ncbi:divalent-cation tolerance protein CutA [Novosphingobium aerophilum]|uniref:divalent-cation tolerance protein CutA n=1 Tax=Novosphingobium TaxID=165696 RepID=UPI0012CB7BA8|nr:MULTISPECIES: divalent-cation tolerance protein CutA [unclassified Novosphingobium]MPS67483.1 divalent-cation tolerance protein CutA [Novosphingobium sp.]WRT93249.1 divalent-cation tolerance protein CutA [Novosphingobium sp. RL4]
MSGDSAIPALIWCPFPDEESALASANILLDEGLVACANLLPGMTSIFVWNGRKDSAREHGLLLKTNAGLLDAATARLADIHPYDEPAVLGWRCDAAATGTVAWLAATGLHQA